MVIYSIGEGGEAGDHCVATKAEAMKRAKELATYVNRVDIGKINKAKILALANGGGYAEKVELIWESPNWAK